MGVPTIRSSTLKHLLYRLALPILVASAQVQAGEIVVEQLIRSTASWDGQPLPVYAQGQPEITILKFTIPAGAELDSHKHSVINAGVLLSGTLTVVSEDQEVLQLKAGDALIELVDKWHHGRNDGKEPAIILVFYAGIKGQEFTHAKPTALAH